MDALQELRIKAEMARALGHDDVAKGLDEAIKTLGGQPQAEMALPAALPPPPPEPANSRRAWRPVDDADLEARWATDQTIEDIAKALGRTAISVFNRAIYEKKWPRRAFDRSMSHYRAMAGGR